MKIKLNELGKVFTAQEQQSWKKDSHDSYSAFFSGHAMLLNYEKSNNTYILTYLNFYGEFKTKEQAQKEAPKFAKIVLQKLNSMISNH